MILPEGYNKPLETGTNEMEIKESADKKNQNCPKNVQRAIREHI